MEGKDWRSYPRTSGAVSSMALAGNWWISQNCRWRFLTKTRPHGLKEQFARKEMVSDLSTETKMAPSTFGKMQLKSEERLVSITQISFAIHHHCRSCWDLFTWNDLDSVRNSTIWLWPCRTYEKLKVRQVFRCLVVWAIFRNRRSFRLWIQPVFLLLVEAVKLNW